MQTTPPGRHSLFKLTNAVTSASESDTGSECNVASEMTLSFGGVSNTSRKQSPVLEALCR